jgi:hypothetical protein
MTGTRTRKCFLSVTARSVSRSAGQPVGRSALHVGTRRGCDLVTVISWPAQTAAALAAAVVARAAHAAALDRAHTAGVLVQIDPHVADATRAMADIDRPVTVSNGQ